jgi:tetratricopeptide (TPR) repeat protein
MVAGSVYEAAGVRDEAVEAYGRAVSLDPSLVQSSYWVMTPEREALRADVVAASDVDACAQGYFAALYGIYVRDLEALTAICRALVELPGGESKRASLALLLFAQGNVEEARLQGERAARLRPGRADTLIMSAVVLSAGDIDLLRRDLYGAAQRGNADASALLAYTYEWPDTSTLEYLNLPVQHRHDEMPPLVRDRLNRLAPIGASTPADVLQRNRMARIYFADIALRQPPGIVLIPGEWSELVPPSLLLALHVQSSS